MPKKSESSIVFITGAFIGSNCRDEWKLYFESNGYKCIAPSWPYKNATPEELRNRSSDDPIALNTITSLSDHFAAIINSLPEKPIPIGHSLGVINFLNTANEKRKRILFFTGCSKYNS